MSRGLARILIGVLFTGLGGSRIAVSKGGLVYVGIFMTLYGLFSVGHGIYMLSKKENN